MKKNYKTEVVKNNLNFIITEGQFKGVEYKYESLTEEKGLQYKILNKSNLVDKNNKYLFENTIINILKDKLGKK